MENLLLDLKSQLAEVTEKLKKLDELEGALQELKTECSTLRKETLGIRGSEYSLNSCSGLLETKTLREIVEEIQFDVKAIKADIRPEGAASGLTKEKRLPVVPDQKFVPRQNSNVALQEYAIVEIRNKTAAEEQEWMKRKINAEISKLNFLVDGDSLQESTLESIFSTITRSEEYPVSTRGHVETGHQINPLTCVNEHTREVFLFQGESESCSFLLSVGIRKGLRLAVYCHVLSDGDVDLGIAITPADVTNAETLKTILETVPHAPDIWKAEIMTASPISACVMCGKYMAAVSITPGHQSGVDVKILEISGMEPIPLQAVITDSNEYKKGFHETDDTYKAILETFALLCSLPSYTASVEIVNGLSVSLRYPSRYTYECDRSKFLPEEVLPFTRTREISLAANATGFEAMFSYEIESTDIGIMVAFKVHSKRSIGVSGNSFGAAFVPLPAVANESTLKSCMDPKQWPTHIYRTCASPDDGEQEIQIRNIRAAISMTDEMKTHIKLRIFAI